VLKETLKIKPKLESSDLNAMERSLNTRFARVAKKFGRGLSRAVIGLGVAGAVAGFLQKLLNPLKEVQDSINEILASSDETVTQAKHFGTETGNLYKLERMAEGSGLDQNTLHSLINKFAGAVVAAKADPTKTTAVSAYKGDDYVEGFYNMIQSRKKLSASDQIAFDNEVFGEKISLKAADFFAQNMAKLESDLGLKKGGCYTQPVEGRGDFNGNGDILGSMSTTRGVLWVSNGGGE
jgi:hypothetical protein